MSKTPRKPPEERGMDALGRPTHDLEPLRAAGDDANDPKRFDQLKNEENARRRRDDMVLQNLMAVPDSREWVYRKFLQTYFEQDAADVGGWSYASGHAATYAPSDPLRTYYNLGAHDLAKRLMADIQRVAPDEYILMLTEQNQKRALRDA